MQRLGWIALASAVAWPAAAHAAPNNFLGGRTGERNGYVTAGFADVEGGIFLPVGPLEIKPRLRVGFLPSFAQPGVLTVSFEPGADIRFQVLDAGDLSGSIVGGIDLPVSLPLAAGAVGTPFVGMGLIQPGWMMTYRVENVVDLDFGLIFEPILSFVPGAIGFTANIPFVFGAEFEVDTDIVLGARFEAGPAIGVGGTGFGVTGTAVGVYFRGLVGASFGF